MNTAFAHQETLLPPNMAGTYLEDVVRAVSGRPGLSDTQRRDAAQTIMKFILLLKPEGTLQLLHAGQAVLFNALTAHAARDVLSAPDDAMTPRALSGVTRTGRLAAKHLDSLSRLQGRFAAAARPAAKAPPEKTPANAPELRPDEPAAVQESAAPATEAFFPRHPRPRAGDRSRCGAGSGPRDEPGDDD